MNRRLNLQPVPNDASVMEQCVYFLRPVSRDDLRPEPVKGLPVVLALSQDRQPAQSRLGALQDEHLEKAKIVMEGYAPLMVMVVDIDRIVCAPLASVL